jgi:hypothetical protein
MKKILTFLLLIISVSSFSQNRETPRYLIENNDTLGIILSVEQVQIIDNKLEILQLFEGLQIKFDNVNAYYIEIINSYSEKIYLLELKTSDLLLIDAEKDKLILNLREQISKLEENVNICDSQLKNKDKQIKLLNSDLNKEKFKKWLSASGNITLAILAIILLVK